MKTLEALEFKANLDKDLKQGKTFDHILTERSEDFVHFLPTKIGQKWLSTKNGLEFKTWNQK
jgi:hypothetical protein